MFAAAGKSRYQPRTVDLSCSLSTATSASPRQRWELPQTLRLNTLREREVRKVILLVNIILKDTLYNT